MLSPILLKSIIVLTLITTNVCTSWVYAQTTTAHPSNERSYIYRSKTGDTPESIAFEFLNNPSNRNVLQRFYAHNKVNLNAISLPLNTGRVFDIPITWMYLKPVTAQLLNISGTVEMRHHNTNNEWLTVNNKSLKLEETTFIRTLNNSFVLLKLPDQSLVSIAPNSVVQLSTLRRYASSDVFKIALNVESGRIESKVTPIRNPAGDYSVHSKRLSTAVRGTEFSVGEDPNGNAISEVQEGSVKLSDAQQKTLALPKGFGTFVKTQEASPPIPLLKAPEWACTDLNERRIEESLGLITDSKTQHIKIDIYKGAQTSIDGISPETQIINQTGILPSDLAIGNYTLQARSIDKNGLNGYSSTIQAINIRLVSVHSQFDWQHSMTTQTWVIGYMPEHWVKKITCL